MPWQTAAVRTDQLYNNAGDGDTWASTFAILRAGGCIAPDGTVFTGASAPQDALNHALSNGLHGYVYWGARDYDPVLVEPADNGFAQLIVQGTGDRTRLQASATDHALEIRAPTNSGFTDRIHFADFVLQGDHGAGNPIDCLHIENVNANKIAEMFFSRIVGQESDRDFIHLAGTDSTNDIGRLYFDRCWAEGVDRHLLFANQHVQASEVDVHGGLANDNHVINWDGYNSLITATDLNTPGSSAPIKLGSNSEENTVLAAGNELSVTDNGTENTYWTPNDAHSPGLPYLPAQSVGPKSVGTDDILYGRGGQGVVDGGTSDHAVSVTGYRGTVQGVHAKTTAGGGSSYDAFYVDAFNNNAVENCKVLASDRDGIHATSSVEGLALVGNVIDDTAVDDTEIYVDGSRCSIIGNTAYNGSGNIVLGSNSNSCVVIGNAGFSVTNNGAASNVISPNTS